MRRVTVLGRPASRINRGILEWVTQCAVRRDTLVFLPCALGEDG